MFESIMPFRMLNLEAVAQYLPPLYPQDVELRVKNREIPFEKRGDHIGIHKHDIDAWASRTDYQDFPASDWLITTRNPPATRGKCWPQEAILPEMLQAGAIASAMSSKTKASVLRGLVALAEKTGQLNDKPGPERGTQAFDDQAGTWQPSCRADG